MTIKQIEQQEKLLEDQLTIIVRYEKEFVDKLSRSGYHDLIDSILDKKLQLRKLKSQIHGK